MRTGRRGNRWEDHRARLRRQRQRLHRRHPVRQGRTLRGASPSPGPPDATVKACRPQRRGDEFLRAIGWVEALDIVAGAFRNATEEHGAQSVWPYYFAGTMGLIQRDSIERFRNSLGYSRQHLTICTTLVTRAGSLALVRKWAWIRVRWPGGSNRDVGWQSCQHPSERDAPHLKAKRTRNAKLVVIDPYRTGTAEKADMHLMVRPGTDAALACAVMRPVQGLRRPGVPGPVHRRACRVGGPWHSEVLSGQLLSRVSASTRSSSSHACTERHRGVSYGWATACPEVEMAHRAYAVSCLPAITGAWKHLGGAPFTATDRYRHRPKLRHGARSAGQEHSCAGHVANWRRVVW